MKRRHTSGVLVLQFGGLGDVVLMSELIGSLKARHPDQKLTLACKPEFTSVVECFPTPPDEVIGLNLNPYLTDRPSPELRRALKPLTARFRDFRTSLLIDGSLKPNWLTHFIAALVEAEAAFSCGLTQEIEAILPRALQWFHLARTPLDDLGTPPEMRERDRYGVLLDYLRIPRLSQFPWRLPAALDAQARQWLNANALNTGPYVVCFPGGNPHATVKRWPEANFIRTIDSIRQQGHSVILLGDSPEQQDLHALARELPGQTPAVFCGTPAKLPLAAAILAKAAAYLGNDSGPMHVAQAYGVPGVAIFGGGGEWPRYGPWMPGSVAMVHPLPCFGCEWDCFLGRGLCVQSIPAETVTNTLLEILKGTPPEAIRSLETVNPELFPVLADASARYRSVQRDRAERLKTILHLASDNERLKAGRLRRLAARFVY